MSTEVFRKQVRVMKVRTIVLYAGKCTFCIYIRKRLYCPCSCTDNKFNVYLKIDSDNGLGVPSQTNETNRAWRSTRVHRSLLFKFSSKGFYQLCGILQITNIIFSEGFLAKLEFSSEFCGKWGIRLECTVCTNVHCVQSLEFACVTMSKKNSNNSKYIVI